MSRWNFKFSDLTQEQPEETKTLIERRGIHGLSTLQARFLETGVLHMKRLVPDELIEAYCAVREKLPKDRAEKNNFYGGWNYPTPYMNVPELRNISLCREIDTTLEHLIGEPMGLHLNLTGWVSTERNFHQDSYLNPPYLWSSYIAVWIALDDIHPDSGPFQYVPGSHKWPVMRRDKLFDFLTLEEMNSPLWPTFTQDAVAKACEEEIAARGGEIKNFLPQKGDVLFWHSNLVHRGSQPDSPDRLRKALICHYSALSKRLDMPDYAPHNGVEGNGYYFNLPTTGAVR